MTTKYQRGANFERRVLKYLIGDNTSPTHGCLHTLIPAALSSLKTTIPPPTLYGLRAAGSRGDFDLIVIGTHPDGNQWVLGIQCKIGKLSDHRMASDLRRIQKAHRIIGVYVYRVGRKMIFYPELSKTINKILGGIK